MSLNVLPNDLGSLLCSFLGTTDLHRLAKTGGYASLWARLQMKQRPSAIELRDAMYVYQGGKFFDLTIIIEKEHWALFERRDLWSMLQRLTAAANTVKHVVSEILSVFISLSLSLSLSLDTNCADRGLRVYFGERPAIPIFQACLPPPPPSPEQGATTRNGRRKEHFRRG